LRDLSLEPELVRKRNNHADPDILLAGATRLEEPALLIERRSRGRIGNRNRLYFPGSGLPDLGAGYLELRIVCKCERNGFATGQPRGIERLQYAERGYGIGSGFWNWLLGLKRAGEKCQRDRGPNKVHELPKEF